MSAASTPLTSAAQAKRQRELVTPEGIALPITIASRGARFVALVVDYTLMVVALMLMLWGGFFAFSDLDMLDGIDSGIGEFISIVVIVVFFLIWNGYFMYFEMGPRGATPGKRIMKIRVASRDGGRLTPEAVVARNLLRQIEIFLPLAFLDLARSGESGAGGWAGAIWFLIFMLFPFCNRDALRAGDLIAGTWVLEAPRIKLAAALSVDAAEAAPTASYRFGEAELAVYGEHELKTLEDVLRRGDPAAMATVQQAICRKIGWQGGAGHEREFLEAFYRALRARLEGDMRFGKRKRDKFDAG